MNQKLLSATVVFIFVLSLSPVYAKTEAGITPDNVFYGLDVFFDDVSLALTFDAQAKTQKAFEIAEERLEETKVMIDKNNVKASETANKEYKKYLSVATESNTRVTKSDSERELEGKIFIEKKAEEHESSAVSVSQEIKLRIELSDRSAGEKEVMISIADSIENSAAETKARIKTDKEQVMARVMQEKGKSAAEVSTEATIIEQREGVLEVKKEKALAALKSAEESIKEAISIFKEKYGFDYATEADVAVAVIGSNMEADQEVQEKISKATKYAETAPLPSVNAVAVITTESSSSSTVKEIKDYVSNSKARSPAILIREAVKHYTSAKSNYDENDYGAAYGQANAAGKLADNAIKIMSMSSDDNDDDNDDQNETELSFETIIKGPSSQQADAENYVINDQEKFNKLWMKWFRENSSTEVNFSKHTVIAVFAGQKNTGGHSIEITKIIADDEKIYVYAIRSAPSPDDIVTQAITSPFHIIKIEKTSKEVKFIFASIGSVSTDPADNTRIKIKTETEYGKTYVVVRRGDVKYEFVVTSTNVEAVLNAIKTKTGLSNSEIEESVGDVSTSVSQQATQYTGVDYEPKDESSDD